ncbi:MAG TPA: helicase C-terminal domain-containing protein, partial [Chloroflexota bacterium]
MAETVFVALDVEVVRPGEDGEEIIELGVVRFRRDRSLESWSSLVRPNRAITERIARLTGITQADLDTAPTIQEVAPRLVALVGHHPIVGQSVSIDLDRLRRHGVPLGNPVYDTFALAELLLPGLSAYDLHSVARALELPPSPAAHRALPDALLARDVFLGLLQRLEQLDPRILQEVQRLARHVGGWPLEPLFAAAARERAAHALQETAAGELAFGGGALGLVRSPSLPPPLEARARARATTLEDLVALLRPGGAVARGLDGYEEREEQIRMLRAVAEAFDRGERLLVEAGTGTGKSLAYLIPAVYRAVADGRPVVVSTNTINLQDQLSEKDLPGLQRCLPEPFRATVLKGRANYLCLRRWQALLREERLTPEEATLLIKTLVWLPQTTAGDRAELRLSPAEAEAWTRIAADAEVCTPVRCPYHRDGSCFLARARQAAERSHVVVVNHALLLADLAADHEILPEHRCLVIDEAHHLEDVATEQFGFALSLRDLLGLLDRLARRGPGGRPDGLPSEALALARRLGLAAQIVETLERAVSRLYDDADEARLALRDFFDAAEGFLREHGEGGDAGPVTARLTAAARQRPPWTQVVARFDLANRALLRALQTASDALTALQGVSGRDLATLQDALVELAATCQRCEEARQRMVELVGAPRDEMVYWLARERAWQGVQLRGAPLHVGALLRSSLFEQRDAVVLTSATLAADGSFRYVRDRLGLDDAREIVLGSPFNYREAALVYVVMDVPEPGRPGNTEGVAEALMALSVALRGRTLALFTSHGQLRAVYERLRGPFERHGLTLLGQGLDGSRARLLQTFKSTDRTVLLGTSSFWEGVDVVGEALSALVIAKLPFSVPSDPVFAARSETFDDPFREYALPQAIL